MATILDLIQTASSDKDIRHLINSGNGLQPSGQTRRGWLVAARKRRLELEVVEVKPNIIRLRTKAREQRRKRWWKFLKKFQPKENQNQ